MSDLNPILEIDNELILFRQIFLIRNKTRTSLLIGQGGRITQHLVEYLAYRDGSFNDNIHEYTFGNFLNQCDFIPKNIRKFILICYEHRKRVISTSKYAKEFEKIQLEFLEAFNRVLNWFRYIYQEDFYKGIDFNELDRTINFLKDKIKKIKENDGNYDDEYDDGFERYLEEHPQAIIEYFESTYGGFEDILYRIEEAVHAGFGRMDQRFDDVDVKLDIILNRLEELNDVIADYQKEVDTKGLTDEEMDKIMFEFADKCIEKIKEYTADYTTTELYKTEEYHLKHSFEKNAWKKLSPESKTFLTTAKFNYSRMKSSKIMDYSGVCLLVTKALELELSTRFREAFLDYLKDKDYVEYPPALLKNNNGRQYKIKKNQFTLGTVVHLFGFVPDSQMKNLTQKQIEEYEKNLSITTEYCKQMLFNNFSDDENIIRKRLLDYGSYVEDIRVDYRNPAAHTNKLRKIDAQECFKFVLDSKKVLKIMLDSFDE